MKKHAIITGITGQDGSYLAELLLSEGFKVIGIIRRSTRPNLNNIYHIVNDTNLTLSEGDITDEQYVFSLLSSIKRLHNVHIYNLAAQSHVGASFRLPSYTLRVNTFPVFNFLNVINTLGLGNKVKFYQASTSEMFGRNFSIGKDGEKYQNEDTPFCPDSPYAASKLCAHNAVRIYRDGYGLFACAGILFNHESPRRGVDFVTRKITDWVGKWYNGLTTKKLRLGNIDAKRDWGYAGDYVKAMHMMLEQKEPDDYVICTGRTYSVRDFLSFVFNYISEKAKAEDNQRCVDQKWEDWVTIDPKLYRPIDVQYLRGDATKAKKKLRWKPETDIQALVKMMVDHDVELYKHT